MNQLIFKFMLYHIIKFSVHNKLVIAVLTLCLVIVGIYQVTKLPIDAVPDITNNQVQIITQAPSYGALDIERLVTFPIEQSCNNISGLKEIRSFSRFGLSLVTIVFNDDVDVYWARQQVSEKLSVIRGNIPAYIGTPELGPISTGLGEIYQYIVRAKKGYEHQYDITELRTIQDWVIRRQLLGVKGVAEVSSFGGKLKQYEIAIHPEKLLGMGLTIQDVFHALEKNNQNTGGAYIEKGPNVYFVRSEGQIKSIEDISNISVSKTSTPILIKDIADVNVGSATRYGAMTYNDEGEVAGAIVMMLKGANSSEVIDNIKERIEMIKKTLPKGVEIEPFLDRTKMVNNAIHTVRNNLIEGALIVLFVLVLFLGNIRAGLIVASVIPLSLLFAICMMNLFGVSGNLMSLGALDFGLIVDGAVIIVEAVIHKLSLFTRKNHLGHHELDNTVIDSSHRMMRSAIFGQLIILIVYIPIFSLEGIEGKMFKPMAQTVSFALIGAFILSVTYIPMVSSYFLNADKAQGLAFTERWIHQIEQIYLRYLNKAFHSYKKILVFTAVVFCISLVVLLQLGGEFIPTLEEGDFAVETRVLTGTNLTNTLMYCQKAAGVLKKFPEVEKVVTKTGSGEVPTDPMPMEASDMMVILKDKSEWTTASTFDELAEKMSEKLKDIPGVFTSFQYPVQMRFNELMTGARQDVVCKIYGENLDSLVHYADRLGHQIGKIDGVENLTIEPILGMPQIVIEFDRLAVARYKLNIEDVNAIINTALAGKSAGQLFEDERRFDIVVRLTAEDKNLTNIENLLIPTAEGIQMPLKNIANIIVKNDINQIQRENARRRIIVGFNVRNRDVQSVVAELQSKVEKTSFLPTGYFIEYGGAFENLETAKNRLAIVVPIALLLIFIMLYVAFRNLKLAMLIFTAIPLSTIGGILFLAIRGMPFSISAGIGFIALFGVAVLNGIVLISEFYRLKNEGEVDIFKIITEGTKSRLRPVLMTAMIASLGFLPMAFSHGSGAEVQRPLATVVIGGLVVATFLTLFVIPILYILIENRHALKMRKSSVIPLILVLLFTTEIRSQEVISLQRAIDSAVQNHHDIENLSLREAHKKQDIKTAWAIPKADLGVNLGSYNSNYFDHAFFMNQSVPFPLSVSRQKKWLESNHTLSQMEVKGRKFSIEKEVCLSYFRYLVLKRQERIWIQEDSVLTQFLEKVSLRYQKGESNLLEKSSAQNQRNLIANELSKTRGEIKSTLLVFNHLIHSSTFFIPNENERAIVDSAHSKISPILSFYEEKMANAALKTEAIRAKYWPDLNVGFSTTTIYGTGADNVSYDYSKRFNSVQLGVSLPIFPSIQAQMKSSKVEEKIAKNELEIAREMMELTRKHYQNQLRIYEEMVSRYEREDLKNAKTMKELANKQLLIGDINYLDWTFLTQQSNNTTLNYLEALKNYYENYYQLKYLTVKEF